jgi:hypothetical protein
MASSILDPVQVQDAVEVESFGAGGQQYIADIWGGINVSAEQVNPLFSFRATDSNVANAAQLTNLTEAQKIGSTMAFKVVQLGLRVVSFKGETLTLDEIAAMKDLLASAVVTLNYGSNETKIGEFTGLHLQAPVDVVGGDATNTCAVENGAINSTAWIKLRQPIGIMPNLNIGGTVKFTRTVPAGLYSTPNTFGFIVIMSGLKIVKS